MQLNSLASSERDKENEEEKQRALVAENVEKTPLEPFGNAPVTNQGARRAAPERADDVVGATKESQPRPTKEKRPPKEKAPPKEKPPPKSNADMFVNMIMKQYYARWITHQKNIEKVDSREAKNKKTEMKKLDNKHGIKTSKKGGTKPSKPPKDGKKNDKSKQDKKPEKDKKDGKDKNKVHNGDPGNTNTQKCSTLKKDVLAKAFKDAYTAVHASSAHASPAAPQETKDAKKNANVPPQNSSKTSVVKKGGGTTPCDELCMQVIDKVIETTKNAPNMLCVHTFAQFIKDDIGNDKKKKEHKEADKKAKKEQKTKKGGAITKEIAQDAMTFQRILKHLQSTHDFLKTIIHRK